MNGEGQERGHMVKSMFLVVTTSHPFLLGLPLPLGWPQSCLFYIPASKACSYFPLAPPALDRSRSLAPLSPTSHRFSLPTGLDRRNSDF